jgi:hypothetical protein
MAGGLGFPFEVRGPSLGLVTDFRKVAFHNYKEDPVKRCRRRDLKKGLPRKPGRSSAIWIRSSEVFQGLRDCG